MQQEEHGTSPLLSPWVIGSMAILALNDHLLKWTYPGWFTGKLSDFAGLVFFPVMLDRLVGSRSRAVWITAIVFVLVKVSPQANQAWNDLFSWIWALTGENATAHLRRDPTDLIALLALWVPWKAIGTFRRD